MSAATRIARALLSFAAICVIPSTTAAQTGSMRVTVPSPTAASLGKFGDVPVNLYTGVPDISIPLFTVKGRTLELPITLRYHAGGIKVEEIAGWAGLGWTLDAGGAITRTVRGLVDESSGGYYLTGHTFYDPNNWPSPPYSIVQNIKNGQLDGEPDRFFFSFGGRSGQFVMGPTSTSPAIKEYLAIPHQKLRIVPTLGANEISKWEVTTEDGTRYTFAKAEQTQDETVTTSTPGGGATYPSDPAYNSSWQLTEIRASGGDVITLHYSTYEVHHRQGTYRERFDFEVGDCVPSQVESINQYRTTVQLLDSIKAATHTVRFTTTLREDGLSPTGGQQERRLDRISIHTPAGVELKRFQFDHDYFPGNRLRLKSVTEQAAGASMSLPPYVFSYDTQTLPDRGSFAQDHWGYYNGETGNSTPIPSMIGPTGSVLSGANRNPNPAFMTAGVLTRIMYPTGGYTEFEMEPNDYGAIGLLGKLPTGPGPTQSASVQVIGADTATQQFTVADTVIATVRVTIMPDCPPDWICASHAMLSGVNTWQVSATESVMLEPGTYTLTATSEDDINGAASISVSWQEVLPLKKKVGSGLRVSGVHTADGMGNVTTRRYRYTLGADTTRSSGAVAVEPRYHYQYAGGQCSYFSRSSMSKMPLGEGPVVGYREVTVLHGDNGEYGKTLNRYRTVVDPDGSDLDSPSADVWPFSPRTSQEWARGQQVEIVEYNAAGQIQRRTITNHEFRETAADSAKQLRALAVNVFSGGSAGSVYLYHPFRIISAWTHPATETTYIHDETGDNAFALAKTYTYGNPAHLQLTELTETISSGQQRITRLKYPADYPSGSADPEAAAITAMKGVAHMHSYVIERLVAALQGGTETILEAEVTTFRLFSGGRYLPYQRFVLDRTESQP